MRATALLIGGTGFAGSHMHRLLNQEYKVIVSGHTTDIRDTDKIWDLVKTTAPDFIINFASITTVRESFDNPSETYQVGFLGTLNLLQGLKKIGFRGRMLNISSSEVYGFPSANELPVRETAAVRPMSPYAVSKAATEALCYQWSQTEQFEIVTARSFTHIGPGQSDKFAISNFAKQIAEILSRKREPVMHVGDLQTTRDLTDVRDVVHAYRSLLEKGRNGEAYNICSGAEFTLRSIVDELIRFANVPITIRQDEKLWRKAEQRRTCGSFEKIRQETGWSPKITLTRTLQDTLSYWRERLAQPLP
jgi:GDP-4-dehydro-6-deoxy-D-mannose reductase